MANNGIPYPTGTTQAEMDAFATCCMLNRTSPEKVHAYAQEAAMNNVSILLGGLIPNNYQDERKAFALERVQDVAHLLAALVDKLRQKEYGMNATALEMSNEPNGHWSTYIAPAVWAKLACATRDALDAKGLHHILISGPGTSMGSDAPYLAALTASKGSRCIGILSTHSWESKTTKAGPHELAGMLSRYDTVRRRFDPNHEKLWVATETGARTNYISGHLFPHNVNGPCYVKQYDNTMLSDPESLSPLFGARVAAFMLLHMNLRFDLALYWLVADLGWNAGCFGLQTRNGSASAVMGALSALFTNVYSPSDLTLLQRTWVDDDTVQAAALSADGNLVLWVAHMPSRGRAPLSKAFSIAGARSVKSTTCYNGRCNVTVNVGTVHVDLPANAVVAVELALEHGSSADRVAVMKTDGGAAGGG